MLEILRTLRDTPIPIVLVIGGLVFLLVPFIRRVSDKVEVETTNKGLAGFIGFLLLTLGVLLYVIPSQIAVSTLPTAIPPSLAPVLNTPKVDSTSQAIQPTSLPAIKNCQESGAQSLASLPSAPSEGCVLIVEWWVPPDANNCGILITSGTPVIPNNSAGSWYNVYPTRPESHIQEFLQKNSLCKVDDQR